MNTFQMEKPVDLLIHNGTVMTVDSNDTVIENGSVAICGDTISAVGSAEELSTINAKRVMDARGGIIMPGLVNTHTHAAMVCFRGLADDLPLMTWLNDHIFPAESKLTGEKVYKGTLLAAAEMIMSGTTCFCDMYLFEDHVALAAKDAGIRAVVGEVLYDFPSPNYGELDRGFEYAETLIKKWKNDPLVSGAVEAHSTYLCAPDLLKRAAAMALEQNTPFVVHLAETHSESLQIKERYGLTPVEFLADMGVLSPNLLACHCVHLNERDISLLKEFDVKISHNPESNMKLASGVAPMPGLIERGLCVGLGTDGCASNNDLDLFSEMDSAAKLHKVMTGDPTVMDARTVVRMATINGAKALGQGDITGSLEVGKKADIIIIDTKKPHLTPMYNPYSHMVYAVRGNDVETSVINGRVVMENRKLNTISVEKAMDDVNKIACELMPAHRQSVRHSGGR